VPWAQRAEHGPQRILPPTRCSIKAPIARGSRGGPGPAILLPRGVVRAVSGAVGGTVSPGRWEELPRAAATLCREQGERRQCPPGYGEGNHHVYGELLGMSSREIKALAEEDVILNVGQ